MLVTLQRVEVSLHRGDDRVTLWHEHSFGPPTPYAADRRPGGSVVQHAASVAIAVKAPVGSRFVTRGDRERIATYFDVWGLDADSVYHLAEKGERGFSIVATPAPIGAGGGA